MALRKTLAALFAGGLLGLQLSQILPPGGRERYWYWPFMDYPMYSASRPKDSTFYLSQLRAVPCGTDTERVTLDNADVGVQEHTFYHLANATAGTRWGRPVQPETMKAARAQTSRLVAARFPGRFCRLQTWRKAYHIGERGLESRTPQWSLEAEWGIPAAEPAP